MVDIFFNYMQYGGEEPLQLVEEGSGKELESGKFVLVYLRNWILPFYFSSCNCSLGYLGIWVSGYLGIWVSGHIWLSE